MQDLFIHCQPLNCLELKKASRSIIFKVDGRVTDSRSEYAKARAAILVTGLPSISSGIYNSVTSGRVPNIVTPLPSTLYRSCLANFLAFSLSISASLSLLSRSYASLSATSCDIRAISSAVSPYP